ncbi:hypothetical protein ABT324_30850 [Saccharopolyspora sp. NPDC000359]|uniref:hypothetical protein n=1 Tax=Saccharopolyspora sp. NPDC000359 TaxID=3154251 RepID=UPI003325BD8A
MSLVHHLSDHSPLTTWITTRCAVDTAVASALADLQRQRLQPRRPRPGLPLEHHAAVGAIVGQRLADAIEPAPPYPALLGGVRCQAWSLADAGRLAAGYPTHRAERGAPEAAAIWRRPTPTGWWQPLPTPAEQPVEPERGLVDVLARHRRAVAGLRRARLAARDTERDLLDPLRALQLLEGIYRGGTDLVELQRIATTGRVRLAADLVDDVLAVLGGQEPALRQARALAGGGPHFGYAAPLLVPGWAEGDVLVGPHPADGCFTLLDVKTVGHLDEVRLRSWLVQTLAYALLDFADRWRIRRVGIWLARHAHIVGWPLDQLIPGDLTAARTEFAAAVTPLAAADGADPRHVA